MSDWPYAQEKPTERLCKIEHYSMLKQQPAATWNS